MPGGASARIPRRRPVASPARRKTTDSASRMSRAFLWGVVFADVGMSGGMCGGGKDEGTESRRGEEGSSFAARSRPALCLDFIFSLRTGTVVPIH